MKVTASPYRRKDFEAAGGKITKEDTRSYVPEGIQSLSLLP